MTCRPLWLTYKQAGELGGQVRKGKKGSLVVYADTFKKTGTDDTGAEIEREIPFMKGYTVFNAEQIDGLPGHFYATVPPLNKDINRLDTVEAFLACTKITIRHGGNRAFYSLDRDIVQMPELQTFRDRESFYATVCHECCHATRHGSRLNRDLGRKRFADAGYAMEELVAEIGAAFLCADLGITPVTRDDHAAYIESWLTVLKDDSGRSSQRPAMRRRPPITYTACNRRVLTTTWAALQMLPSTLNPRPPCSRRPLYQSLTNVADLLAMLAAQGSPAHSAPLSGRR
jgi:antirestriction protein ArdC